MQTMVTAHSGCEGTPDNSLAYVRHALQGQADALEIDVHRRRSGELYISHDPSEAAQPNLQEVFSLLRGSGRKLNCDLKEPGLEQAVLALAEQSGVGQQILFSGEVAWEALRDERVRCRTLMNIECVLPEIAQAYHRGEMPGAETAGQAAQVFARTGALALNVNVKMCTLEILALFRERGVPLSVWTVNEEDAARRMLEAQVFNITSREPGMVCSLRNQRV